MRNKILISALSILAGFPWSAEAENTYVELFINPETIQVVEGKANVEVWYDTDITTLNAFDLRMYVPEGFTIETNSRGKYVFTLNPDEDVVYDHQLQAAPHLDGEDPYYSIVGLSMTNSYLGTGRQMLFSVNLIAPEDFTYANFPTGVKGTLGNITMAENRNMDPIGHYPEEANFTILPKDFTTGIKEPEIYQSDDLIYNLEGLRVYPPLAPGFYIINGEKILVK